MRFRLTFDGELKAAGNHSRRPVEKWQIREALHPQLKNLWDVHPALKGMALTVPVSVGGFWSEAGQPDPVIDTPVNVTAPHAATAKEMRRALLIGNDRHFIPLVRKSMELTCSLDIVFLRKEEPGSLVLQGGDLDNRIKTLFDALSMPQNADDLKHMPDTLRNSPEYTCCLLENDSLITGYNVRTDRLLGSDDPSVNIVRLMIEVVIHVMRFTPANVGFIGD